LVLIGHVHLHEHPVYVVSCPHTGGFVGVADHDGRAFGRKPASGGQADVAGTAGDHRHAAAQPRSRAAILIEERLRARSPDFRPCVMRPLQHRKVSAPTFTGMPEKARSRGSES
jgi:hypothetical protein